MSGSPVLSGDAAIFNACLWRLGGVGWIDDCVVPWCLRFIQPGATLRDKLHSLGC